MKLRSMLFVVAIASVLFVGCSKNRDGNRPLVGEPVTPPVTDEPALSDIFSYKLGTVIPVSKVQQIKVDQSGQSVLDDYDGDGIPNSSETTTNPFVAEYPKIVTRISAPITMEIQVSLTSVKDNQTETIEDSGVTDTITNSMEDRQYSSLNKKTTPYVTKESQSASGNDSYSYGVSSSSTTGGGVSTPFGGANATSTETDSKNESWANGFAKATSSEKTVFEDVNYADNLDKSGTAFTDESVSKITKNSRKSEVLKKTASIGPNAGIVRASLFLKNESVNFPAHISNVTCTLTFRTPAGKFLPVETFLLRNEDYSVFEQDVYGAEELGPYALERTGLNTQEVTSALQNGYIPQIVVVSYDISRVKDSNYNPGVDNLKIVEETSKGRTAYITVSGTNSRESYRVCAFDVDAQGNVSPGISLKKALFNIYASRVGRGESWDSDYNRTVLTVDDSGLKWKANAVDPYGYFYSSNKTGNSWKYFETYVKSYKDDYNNTCYIETIKRIGPLQKYNPFDKQDNPNYDPNQLLSNSEIRKMKYWYVLHNGKYYEGDLNDPIWAGDRYEIICVDIDDYNNHFARFSYTPLQSGSTEAFDTRWNSLSNSGDFARSKYFGKLYQGDCVTLSIDLNESRYLFDPNNILKGTSSSTWNSGDVNSVKLRTEDRAVADATVNGIPGSFDFAVYGGVNCIAVAIGNADNASKYTITMVSADTTINKTFIISSSDLINGGNYFNINRNTLGGTVLPAGTYTVNVKANGFLYGVPVPKQAVESNLVATCTDPVVTDADTIGLPGVFTFNSTGLTNGVSLDISQGTNTEYYEIDCIGPLNPNFTPQTQICYGSSGYNQFTISTPAGFPLASGDPGVYRIDVYAANSKCLGLDQANPLYYKNRFTGNSQYVTVTYEQYGRQKALRAQKWDPLSMGEAVNLEVNFNDGSGWYKLLTRGDDPYYRSYTQFIDCRYYNYIDYKNQKFYVSFTPPVSSTFPSFDVFLGGRDTVDLYIRTEARPEYRDRFWPRPDVSAVMTFPQAVLFPYAWIHGFGLSATDYADPKKSACEYTDATNFDAYVKNGRWGGAWSGVTLGSYNASDYFFSPYEYRVYGVTAALSGDMIALSSQTNVDSPTYNATASGDCSISITNLTSNLCDKYTICYRQVAIPSGMTTDAYKADLVKENPLSWNTLPEFSHTATPPTISGLVPNTQYAVAIVGKNVNGNTKGAVFSGATSFTPITLITPFSTVTPAIPQNILISLASDGVTIHVPNISSPNATAYEIQWTETWNPSGWKTNTLTTSYTGQVMSYDITGTKKWEQYYVYVRAINSNAASPYSDWSKYTIATHDSTGSGSCSVYWVYNSGVSEDSDKYNSLYDDLLLSFGSAIPENAVSYRVSGIVNYTFMDNIKPYSGIWNISIPDTTLGSTTSVIIVPGALVYWHAGSSGGDWSTERSQANVGAVATLTVTFKNHLGEEKSVTFSQSVPDSFNYVPWDDSYDNSHNNDN